MGEIEAYGVLWQLLNGAAQRKRFSVFVQIYSVFLSIKICHLFFLFLQDIQVPVCPLCNTPIPIKRGEMPDIKVGEHIDRDCKSDPAQRKRKVRRKRLFLFPSDDLN